jgi:nitric oxide reductase activation protein
LVSNERDDLLKQLQSAKDEIASLTVNKELQRWRMAAKAAFSEMLDSIKTPRSPLPSPRDESAQATLRTFPVDDGKESDTEDEEDGSQQGKGTDDSHSSHT